MLAILFKRHAVTAVYLLSIKANVELNLEQERYEFIDFECTDSLH